MDFKYINREIALAPQEMQALVKYWNDLRGERLAPTMKEFDLLEIPSHLLPHSLLVDYNTSNDTFKFRFFGTEMVSRHGEEMTGRSPLDFKWSSFGEVLEKEYRKSLKHKRPEFFTFDFIDEIGARKLHEVLRLPLSDDGEAISGFAVVLNASDRGEGFREFYENPKSLET